MMDFIHVGLDYFHDHIITEAVNSLLVVAVAKVNIKIADIAVGRVSTHPHFYAVFYGLGRHILAERQSPFEFIISSSTDMFFLG